MKNKTIRLPGIIVWLILSLVLASANLNAQWTELNNPSNNGLYSIDIHGNGLCIASGIDMVKSTDFGLTWQEIIYTGPNAGAFDPSVKNSVDIIDNTTIVFAGWHLFDNKPIIMRSTNSGVDWDIEYQGAMSSGLQFRSVKFFDASLGLAVGDHMIYRTTDGGDNWNYVSGAGVESLLDLVWLSSTEVVIVGTNRILRSTNGGASFTIQTYTGKNYRSISQQPVSGNLFACYDISSDNYQSISTDGGLTWVDEPITGNGINYSHQSFESDSIIYGHDGSVTISYTGGSNPFLYTDYPWSAVRDLKFANGVGLLVAGYLADAKIYRYDINTPPNLLQIVNFSKEDTICANVPATYIPDHNYCDTYEWLVNGIPVSTDTTLVYAHPNPGLSQVQLVTTYNGVFDTVTKNVTVLGPPVLTLFTVLSDTLICDGDTYTLSIDNINDQDGYQVYNNGTPISPTSQVGSITNYNIGPASSAIEFAIQKWVINECDSLSLVDTFYLEIESYGLTSTTFYSVDTLLCKGDSTQIVIPSPQPDHMYYIYEGGALLDSGFNSTGDSLFFNTSVLTINKNYTIEVSSPILGCTQYLSAIESVNIDQVSAAFTLGSSQMINTNLSIGTFGVTGSYYDWGASGAPATFTDTTNLLPTILYDSTGIFEISLIVESQYLGCLDSSSQTVSLFKLPPDSTSKEICFIQEMNFPHRVTDKHVDIYGNVIVVGFYEDTNAFPYDQFLASIQKYDGDGNLIWSWYENPNEVSPNDDHHCSMIGSITSDSQGNIYVTGIVHGSSFKYGSWNLFNSFDDTDDVTFIIKLDADGNFLWWVKNNPTLANQYVHGGGFSDVAIKESQNKILVPCEGTAGPFQFSNGAQTVSSQGFNVFILDLDGNYINHLNSTANVFGKEAVYSSSYYSYQRVQNSPEVFIDENGIAYVVGEVGIGVNGFGSYNIPITSGNRAGFIAKMNIGGSNPSWMDATKTYECLETSSFPYSNGGRNQHMTYDSDNNVYQCVNFSGNYMVNGDTIAGSGSSILKYDANLNFIWKKNFGFSYMQDIFCGNDLDVYFEGIMNSSLEVFDGILPEYKSPLTASQNIYFGTLNAFSNELTWLKQFGAGNKEFVDPIGGNTCGDVYFSGQSAASAYQLGAHTDFPFELNGTNYGIINGDFMFKLTDSLCVSGGCATFCLDSNLFPSPVISSVSETLTTGTFSSYEWYLNGNLLSGIIGPNLTPTDSGQYTVIVTDANGCFGESNPFNLCAHSDYYPSIPVITFSNDSLSTGNYATYQWYLNSNPISGAIQQSILCSSNGNYDVDVTSQWGCLNSNSLPFVMDNLSIADLTTNFNIYPNPTQSKVNIQFDGDKPLSMFLTDLNGKKIAIKIDYNEQNLFEIDMSGLENGIYFLNLSWNDSTRRVKIVKL
ncbi:MAG: T9SS type A sorting domain-containing protein [Crocinitomicaceae bacterium]|nr:T9SS type A sorting domain-containing protein [Crocinitomicaceae bacterium]